MRHAWMLLPALAALGLTGCPVLQDTDTPVDPIQTVSPRTDTEYWIYVPSYYRADRAWPLVITLHGTDSFPRWDTSRKQIDEWRALAEEKGFIVVAPELDSVQGILPVPDSRRLRQLRADEQAILSVLDDAALQYRIDMDKVLLTGFSAGGFPLYFTAARNPRRFACMVARSCNSDQDLLEAVPITDQVRQMPGLILWGKSDPKTLRDQSWQAFRHFRRQGWKVQRDLFEGGHLRRPRPAWEFFARQMQHR